jgi:release factor glutamine methyltransferase
MVTATDVSASALDIAVKNAVAHRVASRIRFERADLVTAEGTYDLIVSNPPYVASPELASTEPEVREHEPQIALDGGADGLQVVKRLLAAAERVTMPGAQMLIEVGLGQAASALDFAASKTAWTPVATYRDLNRVDRVIHLRRI